MQLGQPPSLVLWTRQMTDDKIAAVRELLVSGVAVKDAAAAVGVSVPTLYRWLPESSRSVSAN